MSTARREDPVLGYNFQVTLLDSTSALGAVATVAFSSMLTPAIAGFSECTGLDMSLDVQEHMEGGGNHTILKFPTRIKPANLTLKRGLTSTPDLWNWFYGFVLGTGKRRDGLVTVLDSQHQPHTVWGFRRGLPVKYAGPQLQAGQSNVAIESIEIAHEGLYQMAGASPLARAVSDISAGGEAMNVIIDEITANVRAIDRDSVLDPRVLGQIIEACLRAVDEKQAHDKRKDDERSVGEPHGLRPAPEDR